MTECNQSLNQFIFFSEAIDEKEQGEDCQGFKMCQGL